MKQKTQPLNPTSNIVNQQSDEVDLREITLALWSGKLIVTLSALLFMFCSSMFVFLVQEWWSSSAKITRPQPYEMAGYQQQVKQFQPIFDIYQEDGTVLVSTELNELVNNEILFKHFLDAFNSNINKRKFLNENHEFLGVKKDIELNSSSSDEDVTKLYVEWFDKINTIKINKKSESSPYLITLQSMEKGSSFNFLNLYISRVKAKVQQDAFDNLQALVDSKRNELTQQQKILKSQAGNKLLIEAERTKYAVAIAQAAGVDKPIQISNENQLFNIELGTQGLEAKIQALQSVKNLGVIEPRLQQINAKLDMLNNLEIDRTVEFQTFRYLENVEQPITRDKPKRALIVVLGTLLGGMLGVAIVLIRFAFRTED